MRLFDKVMMHGLIINERVIMDFDGNLLTRCDKTYLRAFLSWIPGMALSMK